MEFIAAKDRFHALRMKIYPKEPSTEVLINKFHKKISGSVSIVDEGLKDMRDLQKKAQKVTNSQNDLLKNV